MILVDPYPRTLDQIFSPASRARLEALAPVTWHDGPPAPAELVDPLLPELTGRRRADRRLGRRLARAPYLRAVLNVEGNFLPNVDYPACFARGIDVLGIARSSANPSRRSRSGWRSPQPGTFHVAIRDPRRHGDDVRRRFERRLVPARRQDGRSRRLRQPGTRVAAAARAVSLRAARARSLAPRRRAVRALGVEPVGARSSSSPAAGSCSCSLRSRPRTPASIGRTCFEAMGPARWSCSSRARRSSTGRRCSTLPTAGTSGPRSTCSREEPIPAAERARATPGTISPRTGPGTCPRSGGALERWLPTTSKRSSPDGRRPACNVPTRRPSGGFARGRSAS